MKYAAMKNLFILFISFFCIQTSLYSQYYQSKVYGQDYHVFDLVKDNQQNIYLCGTYDDYNGLLVKLDSNGTPLLVKTYSNSPFNHVLMTNDSMLLLSGMEAYNDAQVTKCDLDGNVQWCKRIDFGSDYSGKTYAAVQCYDNSYVLCGTLSSYSFADEVFVSKISETGSEIWSNTYACGNSKNYGVSLIETSDSAIVVCGSVESNTPFDGGTFLMKLDMTGDTIWSKMYNTDFTKYGIAYDLIEFNNAIYFVSCLNDNIILVKCDLNGDFVFAKKYDGIGGNSNVPESSAQFEIKSNGNFLFTISASDIGYNGTIIETDTNGILENYINSNANGAMFMEMNNTHLYVFGNGPLLMTKDYIPYNHFVLYEGDSLGYNNECMYNYSSVITYFVSVLQRNCSFSISDSVVFSDVSLVADTSFVNSFPGCVGAVGAITEEEDINFTLYPNPTNQILNISISNAQGETGIIEIFSTTGALLYSENLKFDYEYCLNVDFLHPGMYLLSIRAGEMKGAKWFEVLD